MNKEPDIVRAIGRANTILLEQALGATRKYIPQVMHQRSVFVKHLGWDVACQLSRALGGLSIYIPTTLAKIDRNLRIQTARASGTPVNQLSEEFGLGCRAIRKICQDITPACTTGTGHGRTHPGCGTKRGGHGPSHHCAGRHTAPGQYAGEQCH